jgi:cell division transport system permease protein
MLLYYLKETFNSLFNSKLGSLLIIITTAIAIIFVTFSVGLVVFSNSINSKLKENIKISLFVNDSVTSTNYANIESELKENNYVESYNLISKDEALKVMKQKTGKDFLAVLEANPLPASYVVKLHTDSVSTKTIEPIIASLKNTSGIAEVVYDYTLTLKILNYINSSKKIIYGVSIFLVFLSIYLVYSNNRLLLSSRLNQYNTMKLVGARLRTIKIPIILNGVIMGLIGSGICLALYYLIINFASKVFNMGFIEFDKNYLIAIVVLLGISLGFLGSFLATLNVSLRINKTK